MTTLRFEDLNLTTEILNATAKMGFIDPSPIQEKAIPTILQGADIIGQAQTGTGKTAAFAIPIIEKINPEDKKIQALVLCPTRELAIQVTKEFHKLMCFKEGIGAITVYGGQAIEGQIKALKTRPQIIIGTPGRIMDHLRRGSMKFNNLRFVVLDEADEMLDMGFREDIEIILKDSPEERQTVMFSATMPQDIIKLTRQYQRNPVHIDVTDKKINAPKIEQLYFEVKEKNKPELLVRLIDMRNIRLALVFCNTKSQVDYLVELLKDRDYFADGLHGDMSQKQREKVMNSFRKGTTEILVATDVAGRGIDVDDIETVFNYDLPRDDEDYTHRIGRTARAGKAGVAISLISTANQLRQLKKIERSNGVLVKKASIPSIEEIETAKTEVLNEKVQQLLDSDDIDSYICQVEKMINDDHTALEVAAVLLKLSVEKDKMAYDQTINFEDQIDEDEAKPKSSRRGNYRSNRRAGRGVPSKRPAFNRSDDNNFKTKNRKQKGKKKFHSKKSSSSAF